MAAFPFLRAVAASLLVGLLGACTSGAGAIVDTAFAVFGSSSKLDALQLNPQFRYLRVTIEGRPVFMALGYVDADANGPVEVWYSAEREVIRLRDGRLVGATGLTREWRTVTLPTLPSWASLAETKGPYRWTRRRDVMPGYRFGVVDELELTRVERPDRSQIRGVDPSSLAWFEERVLGGAGRFGGSTESVDIKLPVARYAVDMKVAEQPVVYAEQCVSVDVCFTWQRWSAAQQAQPAR